MRNGTTRPPKTAAQRRGAIGTIGAGVLMRLALLSAACATAAGAQPAAGPQTGPSPAARVGSVEISQAAVQEIVKSVLRSSPEPPDSDEIGRLSDSALHSLIDLELLYQEAQRRHISVSDAQVDAEIERVRGHFAGADEFSAALQRSNLSREQLRADTRKTMMVDRLLRSVVWADIQIPDEKVREFYDNNRAALSDEPSVHLREIVLAAGEGEDAAALQRRAAELRRQLADGADFAELAYNYSVDRAAAARGGDRGFVERSDLAPAVAKAAFRLAEKQISDVIPAADGLHIIQVIERKPAHLPALREVRPSIVALLAEAERRERRERFVDKLREKADIEIYPPYSPLQPAADTPITAAPQPAAELPHGGE